MMPVTKDCTVCGMPTEVINQWVHARRVVDLKGKDTAPPVVVSMVTTRCLNDHWYGGPLVAVQAVALQLDTSACPCCGSYPCGEPCTSNHFRCCPRCY